METNPPEAAGSKGRVYATHLEQPRIFTPSKKFLKKQVNREIWLSRLEEKRAKERRREKNKREQARKNNISLGPTRHQLKSCTMANSKCKVTVVLDFSFDHLMSPLDVSKTVKQAQYCYSANRRAVSPLQLCFSNLVDKSREEIAKYIGYEHWDVNIHTEHYLDLFTDKSCVYLTSESPNVIETFEDDKIYIIGAFVDHNQYKGLCLKLAKMQDVEHAQLPLGKYLSMQGRKVLTINHVYEIIVQICNGSSWPDALMTVLPQRKLAAPLPVDSAESTSSAAVVSGSSTTTTNVSGTPVAVGSSTGEVNYSTAVANSTVANPGNPWEGAAPNFPLFYNSLPPLAKETSTIAANESSATEVDAANESSATDVDASENITVTSPWEATPNFPPFYNSPPLPTPLTTGTTTAVINDPSKKADEDTSSTVEVNAAVKSSPWENAPTFPTFYQSTPK